MKILFYRYGSICEPDIIAAFQAIGLTVIEENTEITHKSLTQSDRLTLVENHLKNRKPLFVFSVNFFPVIAGICQIYHTPYLCWTVDSPIPELFDSAIKAETNRVFLFDNSQYQCCQKLSPDNTYHLPLASATARFDQVISSITEKNRRDYSSDISFVGSLYAEKDVLHDMSDLSDYARGCITALTEASLKIYGYYPVETALTDQIISELKEKLPTHFLSNPSEFTEADRYIAANRCIGYHVAAIERPRTLNALAEHFNVDLYTRSDCSQLKNVHVHGGVQTLTEMPIIFHLSKINLNMTVKSIQSGLPLRIFDILGCGGFLMTNFQSEITDYFEIGTHLEAYSSIEELIDKCNFYLNHDDIRTTIARKGYELVKEKHTYFHRIRDMLQVLSEA